MEPASPEVRPAAAPAEIESRPVRRQRVIEVWLVLALSLGASGVYAVLNLVQDLTQSAKPLSQQVAVLNGAVTPGRPLLDLAYQLVGIASTVAPVALVAYLLSRSGESLTSLGFDLRRPRRDLALGAGLAAVIGGAGLGLYLGAYHLGASLNVVATTLPPSWWRIPVLLLQAAQNGALEEVVVCGYLLRRLDQIGWGEGRSLVTSAVIRGSYHLYQGFGGFAGNLVMGLIFGRIFQRRGRVAPLAVAHFLIDAVAFVGYALLVGKVSWLPQP
ncbi:MAG: CPBP family intramembrane glutamic endopeptidase [Acidimicrobiales bacterium]